MSTKERDKCSLSSLLPVSCRDGADAFARHLHSRLRSLGSDEGGTSANESSWLASHETSIAVSNQPRHSTDSESYFNNFSYGLFDSPGSPEEEITESELHTLINSKDNLSTFCNKCACSKHPTIVHTANNAICNIITNNHDSDSSDGPYYDTITDTHDKLANGIPSYDRLSPPLLQNGHDSPNCTESTVSVKDTEYQSFGSEDVDLVQNDSDELDSVSTLSVEQEVGPPKPSASIQITKCDSFDKSFHDEDDIEERTPRVRRCSSLKSGKTPPGTPGQKKIVRFADVLGLDLADVRTFLDEIPKIPISAFNDLTDADLSTSPSESLLSSLQISGASRKPDRMLVPLFQQPGGLSDFFDRVKERNVCLENAIVSDLVDLSIKGTVRVRNLDFNKSVHIRYTLDMWKTYADIQATYVANSCDGFSDIFSFLMYAHTLGIGQNLEFAVRFQCKGCQYWDNNDGANYCFQCLPSTNTGFLTNGNGYDEHWGAGFY